MKLIDKILRKIHWYIPCKMCGQESMFERCNTCTSFLNGAWYISRKADKDYKDDNLNLIRDKIMAAKSWDAINPEEFILARDKWLRKHKKWLMDVKNKATERVTRKQKEYRDFYEMYVNDRNM